MSAVTASLPSRLRLRPAFAVGGFAVLAAMIGVLVGPASLSPAEVAADVAEGWITGDRAAAVYGVVLDSTGAVDIAATAARRETESRRIDGWVDGDADAGD